MYSYLRLYLDIQVSNTNYNINFKNYKTVEMVMHYHSIITIGRIVLIFLKYVVMFGNLSFY